MAFPPRPDKQSRPIAAIGDGDAARASDTQPSPAMPPAELDEDTRQELTDAIARAITARLGHVRISSIPPSGPKSESPRSSIRVAAQHSGTVLKLGVLGTGAFSLLGSLIAWVLQPQYAAPLGQAGKLIAGVIVDAILAAAGHAPPAAEPPPAQRDVPALVAPAPDASP